MADVARAAATELHDAVSCLSVCSLALMGSTLFLVAEFVIGFVERRAASFGREVVVGAAASGAASGWCPGEPGLFVFPAAGGAIRRGACGGALGKGCLGRFRRG
jgi:hypothetical protein